ncbi:MAG: glycosyltransferase family 2 protein [Zestosphaera sp.]
MDEALNTLSSQPAIMIPICLTLSVTYLFVIVGSIGYVTYRPRRKPYRADNVEFVLVTVANGKVKNALKESLSNLRNMFRGYVVWLVIDEGAELTHYLSALALSDPYVRLVVVPKGYVSQCRGKARAMRYFIEYLVDQRNWYVFLDDDNLVLGNDFLYEIPYYEERGYVAFNPILKPRRGRSTLAFIIDWVRYFNDLTFYRFFTGLLGVPLLGLHGELLGIRGDVLRELNIRPNSIAEDFRVAAELVRRNYKTWQSGTIVSIKSPNNLSDLQMQRARWFKGVLNDLMHAPNVMKVLVVLKSFNWVVGILAVTAIIVTANYNVYVMSLIMLNSIYYWTAYMYGVYKSGGFKYILLTPFAWLIEVSSIFRVCSIRGFYVINKN